MKKKLLNWLYYTGLFFLGGMISYWFFNGDIKITIITSIIFSLGFGMCLLVNRKK